MPVNFEDSRMRTLFDGNSDVTKIVQDFYIHGKSPRRAAMEGFDDEDDEDDEGEVNQRYLSVQLAPSFAGQYDKKIFGMDYHPKIMAIGTIGNMSSISNLEWQYMIAELVDIPYVSRDDDSEISRSQRFAKNGSGAFQSPNDAVVEEVYNWFKNLIADDDVVRNCGIDKRVMAVIVARAASQGCLLDLPVLRFPDPQRSYFQLYRIKLTASSNASESAISGEYNSYIYRPGEYFIDNELGDRNGWIKDWATVFNV